jgi:molecular chaperone HscB
MILTGSRRGAHGELSVQPVIQVTRSGGFFINIKMTATNVIAGAPVVCWSCGSPTQGAHFCPSCTKIQPVRREEDYFAFFGMPRNLQIDEAGLERRFHQLSWKLHPDNFVRASENERNLSLELSSELNDAYRALRDPLARVEYLLAHAGMRKEGQHKQQAPPELLEEVFELNESLDELREARQSGGDADERAEIAERLKTAAKDFEGKLREVDGELDAIRSKWDLNLANGADEPKQRELMARMNDILNRRSYIRNLVNKVAEELAA